MYHCRFSHSAEKVLAYWYSFLYHNKRLQGILMFLNVTTVLKMLGVSPSSGYELMHEQNFLVLKVGSRMVVPEKRFLNGCHGIPKEVRIEVHTEER